MHGTPVGSKQILADFNCRQLRNIIVAYQRVPGVGKKPRTGLRLRRSEEALCFGWIDNAMKKMDKERYAQRFSPLKSPKPKAAFMLGIEYAPNMVESRKRQRDTVRYQDVKQKGDEGRLFPWGPC